MILPLWLFIVIIAFGVLWIWVGSREVVGQYRIYLEKRSDNPSVDGLSFSFSAGSAYCIFMAGWGLLEQHGLCSAKSLDGASFFRQAVVFGSAFMLFFAFWLACEMLLRYLARHNEPAIIF